MVRIQIITSWINVLSLDNFFLYWLQKLVNSLLWLMRCWTQLSYCAYTSKQMSSDRQGIHHPRAEPINLLWTPSHELLRQWQPRWSHAHLICRDKEHTGFAPLAWFDFSNPQGKCVFVRKHLWGCDVQGSISQLHLVLRFLSSQPSRFLDLLKALRKL